MDTLNELKHRKDELISKSRRIKSQTQSITETGDILETVARMEAKIEVAQAESEIRNEISKTLGLSFDEQRVRKLGRGISHLQPGSAPASGCA